jgi:hypothetical protein
MFRLGDTHSRCARGYVFALCELEDILYPVNDGEPAEGIDATDIAGTEPSIIEHRFGGFVG